MSEEMSVGVKIAMGAGFVAGMIGFIFAGIGGAIIGMIAGVIFIGAPVGGIYEGIQESRNKE